MAAGRDPDVIELGFERAELRAEESEPSPRPFVLHRHRHRLAQLALGSLHPVGVPQQLPGEEDEVGIRARYEAIAADPDEGTAPLLNFLEKRGDLRGALAAVEAALQRNSYHGDLGLAHL